MRDWFAVISLGLSFSYVEGLGFRCPGVLNMRRQQNGCSLHCHCNSSATVERYALQGGSSSWPCMPSVLCGGIGQGNDQPVKRVSVSEWPCLWY
jgi:hypothetical protein